MTDLSHIIEKLKSAPEFAESKNYYFQDHDCSGEVVRVRMDYKLKNEETGEYVRFGFCPKCGLCYCYYNHEDF